MLFQRKSPSVIMTAYLTHYLPPIHSSQRCSCMTMLMELHKTVWVISRCLLEKKKKKVNFKPLSLQKKKNPLLNLIQNYSYQVMEINSLILQVNFQIKRQILSIIFLQLPFCFFLQCYGSNLEPYTPYLMLYHKPHCYPVYYFLLLQTLLLPICRTTEHFN